MGDVSDYLGISTAEASTLAGHEQIVFTDDHAVAGGREVLNNPEVVGHEAPVGVDHGDVTPDHSATPEHTTPAEVSHEVSTSNETTESINGIEDHAGAHISPELSVEYPEQTFEFGEGDSVSRIMDIETIDHGKEMFPTEWAKALSAAGGNETIAQTNFNEYIHDWKMEQLKDMGLTG